MPETVPDERPEFVRRQPISERDDLLARKLKPVLEVDGIAREIASQMSGDDGPILCLFDCDDLCMEMVFTAHLLRPGPDGSSATDVLSFIANDGVLGETAGDAVGIIAVCRGEVGGDGLRQVGDHGFNSSAAISSKEVGLYHLGSKAARGCHSLARVKHSQPDEDPGGKPWMSA